MPKAAQKIQHKVHSTQKAAPDFLIENHGSLFFLRPMSQSAREWVEENISQTDSFQPPLADYFDRAWLHLRHHPWAR
jgi:hypothetical protein